MSVPGSPTGLIHACTDGAARCTGPFAALPAELVEVATVPVIAHAVGRLAAAGVRDVGIVVDEGDAHGVRAVVDAMRPPSVAITYVASPGRCDLLGALRLATDFIDGRPVVVHAGHGLLLEDLTPLVDAALDGDDDVVVVRALGETSGSMESKGAPLVHLLRPRTLGLLEDGAGPSSGAPGEDGRMLTALTSVFAGGGRVAARWIEGVSVLDTDPSQLLHVNREMLQAVPADHDPRPGVAIQGPVVVHKSASIASSVIRGPAIVAPGARVVDSYVGPYTSVGHGAVLAGVEVENSIVMSEAELQYVGQRIEGSVIGRRSHVHRDFSLPRALHLHIGEAARLVIS